MLLKIVVLWVYCRIHGRCIVIFISAIYFTPVLKINLKGVRVWRTFLQSPELCSPWGRL